MTLHLWVSHLNYYSFYICCLYLYLKKTLGYIALMAMSPKLQPNLFVSNSKRWVILHSWLCHLNYSLCLSARSKEYIGLHLPLGVPSKLQPDLFVSFTYLKHWVILHSWFCHLDTSLCLLALPKQNIGLL